MMGCTIAVKDVFEGDWLNCYVLLVICFFFHMGKISLFMADLCMYVPIPEEGTEKSSSWDAIMKYIEALLTTKIHILIFYFIFVLTYNNKMFQQPFILTIITKM